MLTPAPELAEIAGYYTLSSAQLLADRIPDGVAARLGRCPVPTIRLARLAVGICYKGRGIGQQLVFEAGVRCLLAAEHIGGSFMIIDAKPSAIDFYRKLGAVPSTSDAGLMFLPYSVIAAAATGVRASAP